MQPPHPPFVTLLPIALKLLVRKPWGVRSERCLPHTPASDLRNWAPAPQQMQTPAAPWKFCAPAAQKMQTLRQRRRSLHGTSSPKARGCRPPSRSCLRFEKWYLTGMLSSSVELAGIFLAFPVPRGEVNSLQRNQGG